MFRLIALSGSGACHEVADQIGAAERDDEPGEQSASARATAPGSDGCPTPGLRGRGRMGVRPLSVPGAEVDPEIARRAPAPGGRRRQPHHEGDDDHFDRDRDEALPEKDRVAERDDAARHHAAVRDDVADLRLQRAGGRHLQRRRSAEALRPDAAEAEHARRRERAVVDALDAPRDFDREHRAEDEAEAPVEPRRGERDEGDQRHRAARRARHDATTRITRPIGGEVASTWPVMMISAIWSVNGISSQKPRPQASTTCSGPAGVAASAATMTSTVASSAKMKASGSQRSLQSVSASAARATGPGCSVILSGG